MYNNNLCVQITIDKFSLRYQGIGHNALMCGKEEGFCLV